LHSLLFSSASAQVGVPFALTVDFQTVQDRTVTIRERDSTLQV
jgi:glycyl-tRNA synthetase